MKLIKTEQEWIAFRNTVLRNTYQPEYQIEVNVTFDEHNALVDYDYRTRVFPSYPALVDYAQLDDKIIFIVCTVEDAEELLSAAQAMFRPMESGSTTHTETYTGILTTV